MDQYANEVAKLFALFPQFNVSAVAKDIGINKTLLSNYINGFKKPSRERVAFIRNYFRKVAMEIIEYTESDDTK